MPLQLLARGGKVFSAERARSRHRRGARYQQACALHQGSTSLSPARQFLEIAFTYAFAAAVGLVAPDVVQANTVRVEDVENPSLQAGLLAANQGNFREAERFFQIVLKEDEDSASAWSNIGNVHLSLGRPLEAISDFTKAISLAPEAPVPYLNRALAREALGVSAAASGDDKDADRHFKEALQDCDDATTRDPKEFAAWFDKGNILVRLSLFKEALNSYTKAADLAPGISGYRLREAELMFQEGQAMQSDRMMRGVVRKNPNFAVSGGLIALHAPLLDVEAQAALAAVEWASGNEASAEEHFEVATRIDSRWSSIDYIRTQTRWPPALYKAMQNFLSIVSAVS